MIARPVLRSLIPYVYVSFEVEEGDVVTVSSYAFTGLQRFVCERVYPDGSLYLRQLDT